MNQIKKAPFNNFKNELSNKGPLANKYHRSMYNKPRTQGLNKVDHSQLRGTKHILAMEQNIIINTPATISTSQGKLTNVGEK